MDIIRRSIVLILFLVFLIFSTQNYFILISLGMNIIIICKPTERTALLSFKQHLRDPIDSLSSWSGENCCSWAGVVCNKRTHHVVQLQLQELRLGGELNPSLQELKQLRHLDLSFNDFDGISIPDFLGTLQSLRYLNLSHANFGGMIPHQLGNLSNLRYLDLSSYYSYSYEKQLNVVGNFQWLSHLSSLKHLDLSGVHLQENASSNWFRAVNMLPSLLVLRLSNCALSGALPTTTSLPYANFTSLEVLDLSDNINLNSTSITDWLYSLTNLQQLDLSSNSFQGTISASIGNLTKLTSLDWSNNFKLEGEIPTALGNLCKLRRLDLSRNKLTGEISGFLGSSTGCIAHSLESLRLSSNQLSGPLPNDQLGRLENLEYLFLRDNSFSGSIPFSIGRLTLLKVLDLGRNGLNGSVPESFGNLSKLQTLSLSYNSLEGIVSQGLLSNLTSLKVIELHSVVLKVSPDWIPPFQLRSAILRNCGLGPRFPNWIQTQKLLMVLDLSSNGFSGNVPTWFWNLSSQIIYLNLSHNHFNGELPKVLKCADYGGFFLNSNQFKGPLPRLASSVQELDLSNNLFSGSISALVCNPPLTHEVNNLTLLNLSNNLLSGDLSQCWLYWTSLYNLRLESNNITGNIPSSMGSLRYLSLLHLRNNSLSGELPLSLRNCTWLINVDIGENVLTGTVPMWLGKNFPFLLILRFRRNKFHGKIPQELCDITSLQILDLAHNNLSGSIPRCFGNLSAMATKQNSSGKISYSSFLSFGGGKVEIKREFVETASVVTKGREFDYSKTLDLVTNMDLSKNNLSGEIPVELMSLIGLLSLNLSENRFTGKIPEKIGNMSSLESLDFSKNRISGIIPQSISDLHFLSNLNLSYNNLSGKIPSSTQLQSFNESSFVGNEDLCGLPLSKCNVEEPPRKPDDIGDRSEVEEDEDWFEMKCFYMSMGVGFVFGFWVFCCVIVLKGSWRIAYFRFLDDMKDKLCLLF